MIGESSGVATLLNNERIFKETQIGPEQQSREQGQAAEESVSDVARFSAEAIALSQEVVATGQSPEQDAEQAPERRPEENALMPPFRAIA